MRLIRSLPCIAFALFSLSSCSGSSEPDSSAGIDARAEWSGSFVSPVLPHPIIEMNQRYFRPGSDQDAEWIAIVPEALADRVRIDAPVRVRGRLEEVELGGPEG